VDARATVEEFWSHLYARDWDGVAASFGPASIYYDVPVGAAAAAQGATDIVRRLRLGLDRLSSHEHVDGLVLVDGEHVVTEHAEIWTWDADHTVTLPFVSMMVVRDGVIHRWRDYWDYGTLLAGAPQWWIDHLSSDLGWLHDATDDW
jgi:limonene-1,2-epoxide hydrolase